MRHAADIFDAQASIPNPSDNRIWQKSVCDCDIGKDVALMVEDIRRFEETGRSNSKTWANSKNKKEVRRMQNTMGYYVKS